MSWSTIHDYTDRAIAEARESLNRVPDEALGALEFDIWAARWMSPFRNTIELKPNAEILAKQMGEKVILKVPVSSNSMLAWAIRDQIGTRQYDTGSHPSWFSYEHGNGYDYVTIRCAMNASEIESAKRLVATHVRRLSDDANETGAKLEPALRELLTQRKARAAERRETKNTLAKDLGIKFEN